MNELLERLAAGSRPYLLLTLLCLVLHATGIAALPALDRDEARVVQATKQMLETDDHVVVRFQDEGRIGAPVGIHWLQATALSVLPGADRDAVWAYRVPSAAAAWAAVLLTFAVGARLFDRRIALLGAGFLGTSILLQGAAHLATRDAVLLLAVVTAQWALVRLWSEARMRAGPPGAADWPAVLVFWAAVGAGILLAGPVTALVVGLTLLAVSWTGGWRWLGGLKPLVGVPLALAIPLPWIIGIAFGTDGGNLAGAGGADPLAAFLGVRESHGVRPGAHLAAVAVAFWPGSLLLPAAAVVAWRERTVPAVRYCLCWLLPAWVVSELVPGATPGDVLPLYPALALLTAHAVADAVEWRRLFEALAARVWYVAWGLLGLVFAGGLLYAADRLGGGLGPGAIVGAMLAAAAGVVPASMAWRGSYGRAVAASLAAAVLLEVWLLQVMAPRLDGLWVARAVADAVDRARPDRLAPVAATGFGEPSLVFALGTDTCLAPAEDVARMLLARPVMIAVVERRQREAFLAALAAGGAMPERVETVRGFDYAGGREVTVDLYRLPRGN